MHEKAVPHLLKKFKRFNIKPHCLPNAIGMWPNEQECLAWCVLNSNPNSSFMEIGSFCGGSAVLMCLCSRFNSENNLSNSPNKIYSVDCDFDKYQAIAGSQSYSNDKAVAMFEHNVYKKGAFHDISEQLICYSDDIPQNYSGGDIGFLFIDGFHSFAQVVKDFDTVKPFLSPDAIVAFHDVSPEVKDNLENEVDFTPLFNSTVEDFYLDEAMNYILKNNKDFQFLDIPVKRNVRHFKETGLTSWTRGTTSPFNSFAAIRRINEN